MPTQDVVSAQATGSSKAAGDGAKSARAQGRSLSPLLALSPYLTRHPAMIALGVLALVVSALAMLSVPVAFRRMIDQGFAAHEGSLIGRYFLALNAIGAVIAIASAARFYIVNWLGERVIADIRRDVFAHLAMLGPDFYETTHSAEVLSRLTADTTQIKAAAGSSLSQFARNLIMLVGALIMMVVTSARLSGLVMIVIPLIVVPLIAYGRVVRRLSRRAQDELAEASAYASENLQAVRTMQAFGMERAVSSRFGAAVERTFEAARRRLVARAGLTALTMYLAVASVVAVLWYGASSVVRGELSGGTLGQFVLYALFAAGALAELSEVWGEVMQAAGAAERLGELMTAKSRVTSPATPCAFVMPVGAKPGAVRFDNVSFAYPGRPDLPVLHDVSFSVAPGKLVALVGPSGSGKTTIFNLLLRFYDPDSGRVLIDGADIRSADLAAVRARTAIVPQDIAVFSDTILENIRYGSPGASEADAKAAAVAAEADGFIRALPEGYATRLGERGVELSGGQRQRLAIARALLKRAPILLLDEATSSLDAESEQLVQKALEPLRSSSATLVIAHRLATVLSADEILVLDGGRIVERGRHFDLIEKKGLYQRLAALQLAHAA